MPPPSRRRVGASPPRQDSYFGRSALGISRMTAERPLGPHRGLSRSCRTQLVNPRPEGGFTLFRTAREPSQSATMFDHAATSPKAGHFGSPMGRRCSRRLGAGEFQGGLRPVRIQEPVAVKLRGV